MHFQHSHPNKPERCHTIKTLRPHTADMKTNTDYIPKSNTKKTKLKRVWLAPTGILRRIGDFE